MPYSKTTESSQMQDALCGKPLKEQHHYVVQKDKGSQMADGQDYEQKPPAARQRDQMDDDNNEPPPPYKSKSPYHAKPSTIIFGEGGASTSQPDNEKRLRSPVKHEENKEGVFRDDPKGYRNVTASPYKPKDTENLFYGYQEPPPKRSIKPVEENHIINQQEEPAQRRAIRGVPTNCNVDHLGNDW